MKGPFFRLFSVFSANPCPVRWRPSGTRNFIGNRGPVVAFVPRAPPANRCYASGVLGLGTKSGEVAEKRKKCRTRGRVGPPPSRAPSFGSSLTDPVIFRGAHPSAPKLPAPLPCSPRPICEHFPASAKGNGIQLEDSTSHTSQPMPRHHPGCQMSKVDPIVPTRRDDEWIKQDTTSLRLGDLHSVEPSRTRGAQIGDRALLAVVDRGGGIGQREKASR
jgi:hypothetical protein